jgi:hypothetical protein
VSDEGALKWRKASFCHPSSCVEVAIEPDSVYVRNSRAPGQEPLIFDHAEWSAFVLGVRNNEFDVTPMGGETGA